MKLHQQWIPCAVLEETTDGCVKCISDKNFESCLGPLSRGKPLSEAQILGVFDPGMVISHTDPILSVCYCLTV